MSIIYRSSLLFSQPSYCTISHMQVQEALYHHKKKLQINQRSTSKDDNYKVQKLSARQAKTIENLSQKTRTYSLNSLLKNYHNHVQQEKQHLQRKGSLQHRHSDKKYFETINSEKVERSPFICPQKMKLFMAGVNYRSKQRARGAGVKKVNFQELKTYFERCPQQQMDFKEILKPQTIKKNIMRNYPMSQRKIQQNHRFRIPSYRSYAN